MRPGGFHIIDIKLKNIFYGFTMVCIVWRLLDGGRCVVSSRWRAVCGVLINDNI